MVTTGNRGEETRRPDNPPHASLPAQDHNPWLVAAVVTLGAFMEVLDTSIANVALPHIAGSLSASQDESAWVLTTYLVANAIVLPISGWMASWLGRKRFYLTSVSLFTLFSALCGLAPALGALLLFRVLQGLAGGGLQPSVQAILADAFPGEKRGLAMALYTVTILVAPVLGPTLGGWITDNYSWRWIFYINIPVGLACAMLTRMVLEDTPASIAQRAARRGQPLRVDWTGLCLLSLGLSSLEIVLDKGQELDWLGSRFIVVFGVLAVASLTGAAAWEWSCKSPIVNIRLLKERNFLFCCLLILGLYSCLYATTFLLPQFMQELLGYTATLAGFVLSPAGLAAMAEVPLVGYLLTRGVDARKLILLGRGTIGLSCWWMSLMNLGVAERNIVWPRVFQVLGVGLTTVPISTIMFRFLPREQSTNAASIYALVRNEGGSLGIALTSTMLQRRAQFHRSILAAHISPSSLKVGAYAHSVQRLLGGAAAGSGYRSLALLYAKLQQQAALLAYMDQFRMLSGLVFCLLPLILFLKRPPRQKSAEMPAH